MSWMAIASLLSLPIRIVMIVIYTAGYSLLNPGTTTSPLDVAGAIASLIGGFARDVGPLATIVALAGLMLYSVIQSIVALLAFSGIVYGAARVLGGTGDFRSQTFLLAAFGAPTFMFQSAVSSIPRLGIFIAAGIFLAQAYLTATVVREVHGLSFPRSLLFALGILVAALLLVAAIVIIPVLWWLDIF